MKLRRRNLNECIELLTFVWLRWLRNYLVLIDQTRLPVDRKIATQRCEKMQTFRRDLIAEINDIFNEKFKQ